LVGFAPLVSSFWYGENTVRPAGVLWPERHDSDGLLVQVRDQAPVWRPLGNPSGVRRSELQVERLARFGLMQRDRNPAHYQDLETAYQAKPSVWVEPVGDWGKGSVRLVELPNPQGTDFNVQVFWVPERAPDAGRPLALAYRIGWGEPEPGESAGLARVVATRSGEMPGAEKREDARTRLFWVDFAGDLVTGLQAADMSVQADARNGRIVGHRLVRNPDLPGWRVEIEVEADEGARLVELSCQLRRGYEVLSEGWNSTWIP